MDAANWVAHRQIGDAPPSACPVIRVYAINVNDLLPDKERQRLKPFITRLICNRDPESERARAEYLLLQAIEAILPIARGMEIRALQDHARALSNPKTKGHSLQSCVAAISAARGAQAAIETGDAELGLATSEESGLNTARAAIATCDAAATVELRQPIYDAAIDILDGVLRIGKQANTGHLGDVLLATRAFERVAKQGPVAA